MGFTTLFFESSLSGFRVGSSSASAQDCAGLGGCCFGLCRFFGWLVCYIVVYITILPYGIFVNRLALCRALAYFVKKPLRIVARQPVSTFADYLLGFRRGAEDGSSRPG